MADKYSGYAGCLLGMAVGDAMGYTVDGKTWAEICEDYGPNGLLGYDVANGCVEVSSYTQIGAYAVNGLMLGITRGRTELYGKFIQLSLQEWARRQQLPRDPERSYCWVSHIPMLRRRHCRDGRMLDALRLQRLGTPDKPANTNPNPGALMAAVAAGLVYDPKRMGPEDVAQLGAEAVAFTHGSPEAFLTGAVLATLIAGILQAPQRELKQLFLAAIEVADACFREKIPQMAELAAKWKLQLSLPVTEPQQDMEALVCDTADQCLSGAMYACMVSGGDFDTAMITAVNHSGRSAAVGAITGAIMGAKLGAEALPEFYLEGLEVAPVLSDLAADLSQGSPTVGLFNDDWDHKYTQGLPLREYG